METEPDKAPAAREPLVGTFTDRHTVELPDGRRLDLSNSAPIPTAKSVDVAVVDAIRPTRFLVCPICLSPDPSTSEHVPPASIGGARATNTCADCNRRFGLFEGELGVHTRNGLRAPSFSNSSVEGSRRAAEMSISFQADGSPVYILRRADPAVADMLRTGSMNMTYSLPSAHLWRTALLKHAYLAACLYLRLIPMTRHAHFLREELLAARDAGRSHRMGTFASALRTFRGFEGAPMPLYLAATRDGDSMNASIGLGRHWMVRWPMPDTADLLHRQIRRRKRAAHDKARAQ